MTKRRLTDNDVVEVARAIEAAHFPMAEVPVVEGAQPVEPAPLKEPAVAYVAEAKSIVAAFNAIMEVMDRPEPEPQPEPLPVPEPTDPGS